MSLLPQNHSEFRTKQYWDDFFLKRENVAFEWYGDYSELADHVRRSIKPADRVLVIGCGNSNFSSDLYDKGIQNVTNLDFSDLVIEEMVEKNRSRTKMQWIVGDMTNMHQFEEGSFDVVFDKGALDALMSTDSVDVKEKALCMYNEIVRVLATNGTYVCITLAERFIIQSLLGYFAAEGTIGYAIHVDCVQSKKESPFVPFYVTITKVSTGATVSNQKCIRLHVDELGQSNPASANRLAVATIAADEAVQQITQIQAFHQKQYQIAKIETGRFEKLQFWSDAHAEIPRFTIFMLDYTTLSTATLSMAVFMVPAGRECDYQFTTAEGLSDIARQANCKRLLAVCLNRPHIYPEMTALQAELNPIVLSLKPRLMSAAETIPYMAMQTESDWETIATGHSEQSGDYVVEESFDDDHPNAVLRRLIFLQNQNFIQTEVRLVQPGGGNSGGSGGGGNKGKGKKGKKSSGNKKTPKGNAGKNHSECLEFDYAYLDAHHCAALCALTMLPGVVHGGHKITNPGASSGGAGNSGAVTTALLVGLGGGALPMCLQRYLPNLHLYMCDLDASVESVAKEHFGFKCNARSQSFVADGLVVVEALYKKLQGGSDSGGAVDCAVPAGLLALPQLDVMFIDADSKDTTLGISAPPAVFLTLSALVKMYAILKPGGGLYINVVARSKDMFADLVAKLAAVFGIGASTGAVTPAATATAAGSKGKGGSVAKDKSAVSAATTTTSKAGVPTASAGEVGRYRAEVTAVRAELGCGVAAEGVGVGKLYHVRASAETLNEGLLLIKGTPSATTAGGSGSGGSAGRLTDCYEREALLEFWLKSIGMGGDPLKLTAMLDRFCEVRL